MSKTKNLNADARSLLRCIHTYADYALEQLDQGATVNAETLQEIQHAKEQTAEALFFLLHDNNEKKGRP